MPTIEQTTEAVFNHHFQALLSRDVAAIMEDYTEDSVAIVNTAPEALHGVAAIRALFEQVMQVFTPEVLGSLKTHRQTIDGEIAYVVWSAGKTIPFASDTFVIRDGKIAVQTAAVLMAPSG
jgi:ketosteroid isomerase-like protein